MTKSVGPRRTTCKRKIASHAQSDGNDNANLWTVTTGKQVGCSGAGGRGGSAPTEVLICRKSGKNLRKSGQNPGKFRCRCFDIFVPDFDFLFPPKKQANTWRPFVEVTHELQASCDLKKNKEKIYIGKVWGNSGKNPLQPQNLPAPTPMGWWCSLSLLSKFLHSEIFLPGYRFFRSIKIKAKALVPNPNCC